MTNESTHVSVVIDRPVNAVYEYTAHPANLPRWAAGLAASEVEEIDGRWVVDSPTGRVTVRFADRNSFGALDHDVTLASGEKVYNPLCVIPHGEGSEVVFTLRRQPGMTDEQFAQDIEAVRTDLRTLKRVLEES